MDKIKGEKPNCHFTIHEGDAGRPKVTKKVCTQECCAVNFHGIMHKYYSIISGCDIFKEQVKTSVKRHGHKRCTSVQSIEKKIAYVAVTPPSTLSHPHKLHVCV
jgi:hypothetical protein